MSNEQYKELVRRFYEAFEDNDQVALKELLSPDLVAYSHGSPGPQSRDVHVQGIGMWNAAFETHFAVEEQIAEADSVATRVTMRAIHNGGEFQGVPPTGKEVVADGFSVEHFSNGKIVERRVSSDFLAIMQQLGLVPPPQPAG
jgi:predicted ester cyclase